MSLALAGSFTPEFSGDHRNEADDLRLSGKPVRTEVVGTPGKILVHVVKAEAKEMLSLLRRTHRFQPGGLLESATDGSRGWLRRCRPDRRPPVFRNLRISELAMTGVCGGRPQPRQA